MKAAKTKPAVVKLIKELGGTDTIAEALDVERVTVRSWHHRGIPRRRWPDLIGAFPNVTFEGLREVEGA